MDALALLCTLHADGPATWRRLRENGCNSLAELARFEPMELCEIIGGTSAGAKRFLREARHLGERSGGSWLEREEPGAAPVSAAPAAVEELLPVRDQQIVENVLRAWREEDSKELGAGAAPVSAAPVQPAPEEPPPDADHALEPNLLDGLSESACERLRAEGLHTLEALLEADLGQLALRSGLGYSRLYRWRSLAERQLRALSPQAAPAAEERLSPAEVPSPAAPRDLLQIPARGLDLPRRTLRWSPLEEGAAGPFA
jgi:predicted RecB family nuclease